MIKSIFKNIVSREFLVFAGRSIWLAINIFIIILLFSVLARASWKDHIYNIFNEEKIFNSFSSAKDINLFCNNFNNINDEQKKEVFREIIIWIAYYESGWNPLSRMTEHGIGIDKVTGKQVVSEGLLQLSYQDTQWHRFCKFDWSKDKYLSPTDPLKTILIPETNIDCGIRILSKQINKYGFITMKKNVYWSVLKINGRYSKIKQITKKVNSLPFCS